MLLHLNGPSGVGKSTLARRWAQDRPGSLRLDIDELVPLIAGWQADFFDAWAAARRLALAMATTHLAAGQDVVLPQMVNRVEEAARFEQAAASAGAAYVEVGLTLSPATQVQRFRGRPRRTEVEERIGRLGDDVLARIHGQFEAYLESRPHALLLETDGLDPESTYARLLALVEGR